jgi:LmbE family N-acetylglucosaminyl deacetylase
MLSLRASLDAVKKILCVGAHPDDIEIGCGATILTLREELADLEIRWVVLTGTDVRRAEAERSARLWTDGASLQVELESFRESYLPYDPAVKDFFDGLGGRFDPDLIFAPWRGDAHQDHRTVANLVRNTFRNHLTLAYEIPKYDGDLGRPSVFMPIDREVADRKSAYLFDCFPSQATRDWFTEETFTGLMRLRGIECRADSGLAEAFHNDKLVLR